jgi:hypothetical protein
MGQTMSNNKIVKLLFTAFLLAGSTHISHASGLDLKLKTQLSEAAAARKVLAEKEITIKATKDEIAAAQKKPDASATKTETDASQDAKIAALEAGILDDNQLTGEVLKFRTNAFPFKAIGSNDVFCAPAKSKARIKKQDKDGSVYVYFKDSPEDENRNCVEPLVTKGVQYTIAREQLDQFTYKRKGIVYGGLVVPFKYYLGGDKRISASSTIAPYVGLKGLAHYGGAHITPIFSAGLGLVPVNKMTTGDDGMISTSTDTKSALSVAAGLVLTHEKNKAALHICFFHKEKFMRLSSQKQENNDLTT